MDNTVYTYDTFSRYDYEVRDFTSFYYGKISTFLKQYSSYFDVYTLSDDEKLENVSYKLYETPDYADLILAINEDVFLWNIPYNDDINKEREIILTKVLSNSLDLVGVEEYRKVYTEQLAREMIEDSDRYKREILVPKNEFLSVVVGLVEKYKNIYNLNTPKTEKEARSLIGDLL